MTIKFTKMHGLGNDFMVIDAIHQDIHLTPELITHWARRDTGIGFDQCLVIEPSSSSEIDFFYRIYNADGTEVGQCGNGARCLARFIRHYGLSSKKNLQVETQTTRMALTLNEDESVTVDMGAPKISELVTLDNFQFHKVDLGNPHAVMLTENIETAPVNTVGKLLCTHSHFPNQCNIGFMQIINPSQISLRVYERGCGETNACGSGAVAAAAVGIRHYNLNEKVRVALPGGNLNISWPQKSGSIFLTGNAIFVYEGRII